MPVKDILSNKRAMQREHSKGYSRKKEKDKPGKLSVSDGEKNFQSSHQTKFINPQ